MPPLDERKQLCVIKATTNRRLDIFSISTFIYIFIHSLQNSLLLFSFTRYACMPNHLSHHDTVRVT